jgi:hypothetical protein
MEFLINKFLEHLREAGIKCAYNLVKDSKGKYFYNIYLYEMPEELANKLAPIYYTTTVYTTLLNDDKTTVTPLRKNVSCFSPMTDDSNRKYLLMQFSTRKDFSNRINTVLPVVDGYMRRSAQGS